jgi:hypothetical protein
MLKKYYIYSIDGWMDGMGWFHWQLISTVKIIAPLADIFSNDEEKRGWT